MKKTNGATSGTDGASPLTFVQADAEMRALQGCFDSTQDMRVKVAVLSRMSQIVAMCMKNM